MPIHVDWTDEPVLTREEARTVIRYPGWMYNLAVDLFLETDMPEMALLRLPFMEEHEVRMEVIKQLNAIPDWPEYRDIREMFPKVWEAHLLIQKTLNESRNPAVCCSFGKDSMTVLHMVLQHKKNIHVLFNNTLVEFPSTIKLARKVTRDWNLNLVEARPEKTFWAVVHEYGWPTKGRYKGKKGGDVASSMCCKYLKKLPTKKMIKKYGWDLTITGLTRHESDVREMTATRYGDYYFAKTWNGYRCHPIMDWTADLVFYYNRYYRLPINEIYRPIPPGVDIEKYIEERDWLKFGDEFDFDDQYYLHKHVPGYDARTGCWPCQVAAQYGKRRFMRIFHPEFFNTIIMKKGLGDQLIKQKLEEDGQPRLAFEPPTVKEVLEMKPCYFDAI